MFDDKSFFDHLAEDDLNVESVVEMAQCRASADLGQRKSLTKADRFPKVDEILDRLTHRAISA